ncbi:hypothetical protein [Parafrankia discariae]|uniref:hypothetical protein n=1 Tax=Parafrankia discariae TaxID=365528 RepID=UPI000374EDC4|nr:hypothetical protein [Parafrankia discariae]
MIYAISGRDFSAGEGLDPDVAAAARTVAARTVAAAVRAGTANHAAPPSTG